MVEINWRTESPAIVHRVHGYRRECQACSYWQPISTCGGVFAPAQHICLPTGGDHLTFVNWPEVM